MKLHKGDKVRIIAGKDKGRDGVIERVYVRQEKAVIPGLNIYKKHVKKSDQFPQGGIVEVPRPIHVSKLMLMSKTAKKPTRVGYIVEGEKKFRVEKRTQERIKK